MATLKFHRVATEGATTDGRKINRQDIVDMAANYDPTVSPARVNLEHQKTYGAYGDVLALRTGEVTLNVGGQQQKRLALYAQIKPLENLKTLNQAGQKIYSSIEIRPNFAATGKAYLAGVAVTDNPASLGVEVLQFCAGMGEKSFLAHRKQEPENLFSELEEVTFDFSEGAPDNAGGGSGEGRILDKLLSILTFSSQQPAPVVTPPAAPITPPAAPPAQAPTDQFSAALVAIAQGQDAATAAATARHDALEQKFTALMAKLEATPQQNFSHRPSATGGNNAERADC